MTSLTFENITLEDLKGIAKWIIKSADNIKVWIFEGEMGAGKTTFIKAICEALGVERGIQSPTFGLVNEYTTNGKAIIYHFDFYRIIHQSEVMDIGFEEYLDSGNYCFIEWPTKIPDLLPDTYLKVEILNGINTETRTIKVYKL